MQPFTRVSGIAAPLDRPNVDTDQIIPKQFLKRIERSGYGPFLFYDWRYRGDGVTENPDFELNREPWRNAPILLAGRNFGCGSSREHAAWALEDYGVRAVIAPSFSDIFRSNSLKIGLLPVQLPEEVVARWMDVAREEPGMEATVDLEQGYVECCMGGQGVIYHIHPQIPFPVQGFNFDADSISKVMDDARQATKDWIVTQNLMPPTASG